MFEILGFRRIVILLVLCAINATLGLAWYFYIVPETQAKERELRVIRNQIADLQQDVDKMLLSEQQIEEQKEKFIKIQDKGFFNDQDRRQAEIILNDIQSKSNVNRAKISIGKGEKVTSEDAQKAGHFVLESVLEISIDAMDDLNIANYINALNEKFPGHLKVESVEFKREKEVNNEILRSISAGLSPDLITGKLTYSWRTLIPDETQNNNTGAYNDF